MISDNLVIELRAILQAQNHLLQRLSDSISEIESKFVDVSQQSSQLQALEQMMAELENSIDFLEDEDLARDVKELYAVNKGDIKSKEDFERKKQEYANRNLDDKVEEKPLSSDGKFFEVNSFLWHLQQREYDVRNSSHKNC